MISTTAQVRQAIEDGRPAIALIEIAFTSQTLYLTDAGRDIQWSGIEWLANGFVTSVPENSVERELRASQSSLGLTGVDLTTTAILLNESQTGRPVTIRECYLDDNGQVIPNPYIRDLYFIDQMSIRQGIEAAQVKLQLAGEFADFEFKNGIKTTDNSLQRYHPGDKFFVYSTAVSKEQRWEGR